MKVVAAYKRGESYKTISKQLGLDVSTVRQVVYKWRNFQTTACLPRSGRPKKISDTDRKMVSKASKSPRITSRELQVNVGQAGVHVHRPILWRTLNQSGLHDMWLERRHYWRSSIKKEDWSSLKSTLTRLLSAGKRFSGQKEPKLSFLVIMRNAMFGGNQKQYPQRSVVVWGYFAASETGRLAHMNGIVNSAAYQHILNKNITPSLKNLKLGRGWIMQQDNDPKHTSRSTQA